MEAVCFLSSCLLFNWVSGLVRKKRKAAARPSLRGLPPVPAGDPFPPDAEGRWYSFDPLPAFGEND